MTIIPTKYKFLLGEPGPLMILEALKLLGIKEMPGTKDNPEILQWAEETGLYKMYSTDSTPWCGLFMAVVAKRANKEPVESPLWALNWRKFGEKSPTPSLGDVLVFRRESGGHVALYVGEDADCWHVLGGNQSDAVTFTRIPKTRLVAARRPLYKTQPENVRPIIMTATGPISNNEQ